MKALELIRTLPDRQLKNTGTTIRVVERIGYAEERTPAIVFSTKQALEPPVITPCWYLEIFMTKDGKDFCTHRKYWIPAKDVKKPEDSDKEMIAKQMLFDLMMGGITQSYLFVRDHLSKKAFELGEGEPLPPPSATIRSSATTKMRADHLPKWKVWIANLFNIPISYKFYFTVVAVVDNPRAVCIGDMCLYGNETFHCSLIKNSTLTLRSIHALPEDWETDSPQVIPYANAFSEKQPCK